MSCPIHQATIEAEASPAERIALALDEALEPEAVAVGLFDRGQGRFEIFAHYAEPPPRDALLALIEGAAGGGDLGPLRIEELAAEDWVTLSQGKRGPVAAGRFLVHGSHDRGRVSRRRTAIEIDAGQAFGTAHHASTRGCLLALDGTLKRRRPRVIIDIGTGTGILALAGAIWGAAEVVALDVKPEAVAAARANAARNGLSARVHVAAELPPIEDAAFDLIVANITADVLQRLAGDFVSRLAAGGALVLSGMLADLQSDEVGVVYEALGCRRAASRVEGEWEALLFIRDGLEPHVD